MFSTKKSDKHLRAIYEIPELMFSFYLVQCIPGSPPLEIELAPIECRAETLPLTQAIKLTCYDNCLFTLLMVPKVKAPFSIATTPRCRGGRYFITPLYP